MIKPVGTEIEDVTARIQCRICKASAGMVGGDKTVFFPFNPDAPLVVPEAQIKSFNKNAHVSGKDECAVGHETKNLEVRYFAVNVSEVADHVESVQVKGLAFKKIREGRFKCLFERPQDISLFA